MHYFIIIILTLVIPCFEGIMLLPATLPSVKWTLIGVWGWWGSWPDTNEPLELPDIPDDEKDVILPPNDESVGVNVRSLQRK